jgi:hypothetical protein
MLHKICSWHHVIKKCTKHRILESFLTDLHQYHQVHKYLFVREISLREPANTTWHVQPAGHGDFHVTALHYADLLLANNRDHDAVLYKNTILLRWMNPCSCCTDKQRTRYCLCAVTYSHGIVHLEAPTTQHRPCQSTTTVRLPPTNVPADTPSNVGGKGLQNMVYISSHFSIPLSVMNEAYSFSSSGFINLYVLVCPHFCSFTLHDRFFMKFGTDVTPCECNSIPYFSVPYKQAPFRTRYMTDLS